MNETLRETLREQTVSLLLAVRNEHLRNGANPMKHWDQLLTRLRSAARTSTNVPEWVTRLTRGLGLPAPSRARSLATDALATTVMQHACATQWLDLVEDEHGYLIAKTQLLADQRKRDREADWTDLLERGDVTNGAT